MKTNLLRKRILSGAAMGLVSGLAVTCMAGPGIVIVPPSPPSVVITAPAPPAPVVVAAPTVAIVPDDYYYDGTEYVGVVGGQYYYLGSDNNWVVMDPVRLHRFNDWQRGHADWQTHAIHNDKYRGHIPAHTEPMHEDRAPAGHDYDHADHGRDHNGPPQ